MFNAGQRPAIELGISVSRVGGAAQIKAMKQVVGSLKIDMAQYRELAAFAQFSSDLDPKTKAQLERGQRITEILKQGWDEPMKVGIQTIIFWAIKNGYLDRVEIDQVKTWETDLVAHLKESHNKVTEALVSLGKLDDKLEAQLKKIIETFNQDHQHVLIGKE
jgi:F-type H+-transporting ATPase subunit alpha